MAAAEREFGVEVGRTLLMAALESPKGILNAYEICAASDRMFGVAISGGDFRKCMQTKFDPSGIDMMVARGQMLIAARAAGIQCFDTVFTDLDDNEGFEAEVRQNKAMGFDGKSLINPKQIRLVHQIFAPTGGYGQRVPRGCGRRYRRIYGQWQDGRRRVHSGRGAHAEAGEGLRHV